MKEHGGNVEVRQGRNVWAGDSERGGGSEAVGLEGGGRGE